MLVRFLKNHTPYLAGETAGFPDAQAKALIDKRVAAPAGPLSAPEDPLSEEDLESLLAGFAQRGIGIDPATPISELKAMAESVLANEIAAREIAETTPSDGAMGTDESASKDAPQAPADPASSEPPADSLSEPEANAGQRRTVTPPRVAKGAR